MRHRPTIVLLAVLALVVGGCSSSDGAAVASADASSSSRDSTTTDDATDDPEPAPEPTRPSPGCASSTAPTATAVVKDRRTLEVDGAQRWYLVTAPDQDESEPAPLVLDFHGLSEGAEFHSAATGWSELAEREGIVVAFPNGTGDPVAWNIATSGPNPDVDFALALVDQLGRDLCIDLARVYSTGLSNGALLSSTLACTHPETFAAIAPVAGVARPGDCTPAEPVPVLTFHGTADPILNFNGGVSGDHLGKVLAGEAVTTTAPPPGDLDGPGYPAAAKAWADGNGCAEPADEPAGEDIILRVWDCPSGADVRMFVVEGGGHTWPGSSALAEGAIAEVVGPTTFEIDATALSWEFFRSHSR